MGPLKPGPGLGRGLSPGLRWAFALSSLALLATVVWAAVAEYRAEWRVLQRRFRAAAPAAAGGEDVEAFGLQQIWLPDVDRVDRCTSCHLGIADPTMKGAPAPFRAHPGRWLETHRPDRFGCTSCHGGQGEATTFAGAAHRRAAGGADAMASRELMEARCGECHRERAPRGTMWLARGRAIIGDRNCVACHELPGYDASEVRAPRLDGLARKVSPAWLRAWLKQPRAYFAKTRMGEFRLSDRDVEALAAFLLGQPDRSPLDTTDWSKASAEKGGEIFRRSRCVTCHAVNGRGGTLGPELTHVGAKTSRDWLYTWLRDPHRLQPKTLMPRFRFADDQARDVAAYLASELAEPPKDFTASAAPPSAALAEEGRRVFEKRGCYSCHDLEGFLKLARIGPKLSAIGDRVLETAALDARHVAPTLPNWIHTKVRTPDAVLEGARMPTFGFDEKDGAALAVALLSLRAREMPPARTTHDPSRPAWEPQGEMGALVRRYRCLSCHSVRGTGGTLSTVALDRIGSQLTREHLEAFVQKPYGVRVSLPERMPQLGVTAAEARVIAGYFSTVMIDDAVEGGVPRDAASIERGRVLFARDGCAACHIAGEKGGYVGPELNGSAARLKPGWTVSWLMTPQRWKPGTLEPDTGRSREEAEALAAYVLSLPPRKAKAVRP
ncbi:MAG: c-type cytochrome [Vicinamibacteria bacterium]